MTSPGRDDPRPVRTVFLGSGGFAVPILHTVAGHPTLDLVAVVTAPARPAGRRGDLRPTPVAEATNPGVAILTPLRLRDQAAIDAVLALSPDLLVLADYGRIVPTALLELPHGALNLHPSLLPRHRGASPVPATILAGDPETGVTLMRMDAGLDTGPIVAAERIALDGTETAPMLEARLAILGADLLARSLAPWLAGTLLSIPQPLEGATLTRPLRREDGRLDPARSAIELERAVRAYRPWPGTFVETDAGRLTILGAEVDPAGTTPPGRLDPGGLGTAQGTLRLMEVQPAGGRPMPWAAYVRGRPAVVGSTILAAR